MNYQTEKMLTKFGNPAKDQVRIYTNKGVYFKSYNSVIASRDFKGNVTIGKDYDYSSTTMFYLSQFLHHGVAETRKRIHNGTYSVNLNLEVE